MSSWPFPPETREVQLDEKWAFVGKKQRNCDPGDPRDANRGDYWDHVAFDPEHKLVLAVVPGARVEANARAIVMEVARRTGPEPPALITSDEYPAYATAIEEVYSRPAPAPGRRGPGRPRIAPERRLPDEVTYATVHKHREGGRVVAADRRQVFGTAGRLEAALAGSSASVGVNTAFIERQNGTDRGRNARKARKTYRFSKDWRAHEAMTYLTMYTANFCWAVRTLRVKDQAGRWRGRSPAMAAGLADHIWTWGEWFGRPAIQSA
jgi:IS1 family transposase